MVKIHNSLTGRKEELVPLRPGRIGLYVCGDTVYDLCHMGHARSKIVFDVIVRYLRYSGLAVDFVRNITDIDDKIIKRAAEQGEPIDRFTARYIDAMHEDYDRLGILRPDHEPRATQFVPAMIEMIATLIDKGYAYLADDGDVMYSVARFEPYGRLSGKRLADLRAGARVQVDEAKRDPLDFVLWKKAKPGEPSWPSPWGPGRPGWHIECSAMAQKFLGTHFDIHGGGLDLKFPHHENEIAQSRAASGDAFADVWMHNGFLNVDNEKMAKSLGNFFTIRQVLQQVRDAEVIRYFVLSSHYRGPINYTEKNLEQADAALERIYLALRDVQPVQAAAPGEATAKFREAMDDDFNTPEALAVLQRLAKDLNIATARKADAEAAKLAAELRALGQVLGVLTRDAAEFLRGTATAAQDDATARIDALVAQREAARQARQWKESDRIRDQLAAEGIVLEDKPGGRTVWRRK